LLIGALAVTCALATTMPEGYRIEPVARGLDDPSALAAAPDGRIFILERLTGEVLVFENGELASTPLLQLDVAQGEQEGLLGIALDPDFGANGHMYLYYTQASPKTHRVVRYTVSGGQASDPFVVVDDLGSATSGRDNGGGMAFGGDGMLYVGVGVFENDAAAQDLGYLGGKILRVEPDGDVPADNPYAGEPYPYNLIWADGVRDPRGIAAHADVGTLYGVDLYAEDGTCDELNVLRSGDTYGWDAVACEAGAYTGPVDTFSPQIDASGVVSYVGDRYPDATDDVFVSGAVASGVQMVLDRMTGADLDQLESSQDLYDPAEDVCPTQLTAITQGADGWLYALSADADAATAGLYRVIYDESGSGAPPREASGTSHIGMTLAKTGTGALDLFWEDLKRDAWTCTPAHCPPEAAATKYAIWQGTLAAPFSYDHGIAEEADGADHNDALVTHTIDPMPAGNAYFLVSARGSNFEGTTGYASDAAERPGVSNPDLCDAIGYGPVYDVCDSDWPHAYPNHEGVMISREDLRGKALMISLNQFG
jgi:glucose/arabinose dehydrogenase